MARPIFSTAIVTALLAIPIGATADAPSPPQENAPKSTKDVTPPQSPPLQPSYVENAGNIHRNEHAFLFFVDAELLPAAAMFGYRYGLFSWWDIGFDVGGNLGVFQALLHTKMINLKTKKTEFFFWGFTFKTGYKYHKIDFSEELVFDDKSWIYIFENPFAFRFGKTRERALIITTKFYIDQDMHTPNRKNDYYLGPVHLGFETVIGKYANFYVEVGYMWAITGMDMGDGEKPLYKGDWFPVMQMGFAARTGDKTAKYGKVKRKKKSN